MLFYAVFLFSLLCASAPYEPPKGQFFIHAAALDGTESILFEEERVYSSNNPREAISVAPSKAWEGMMVSDIELYWVYYGEYAIMYPETLTPENFRALFMYDAGDTYYGFQEMSSDGDWDSPAFMVGLMRKTAHGGFPFPARGNANDRHYLDPMNKEAVLGQLIGMFFGEEAGPAPFLNSLDECISGKDLVLASNAFLNLEDHYYPYQFAGGQRTDSLFFTAKTSNLAAAIESVGLLETPPLKVLVFVEGGEPGDYFATIDLSNIVLRADRTGVYQAGELQYKVEACIVGSPGDYQVVQGAVRTTELVAVLYSLVGI